MHDDFNKIPTSSNYKIEYCTLAADLKKRGMKYQTVINHIAKLAHVKPKTVENWAAKYYPFRQALSR